MARFFCAKYPTKQAKDPGTYWRKLKQRLKAEGSEIVTNCHGLKLQAADGNHDLKHTYITSHILIGVAFFCIYANKIFDFCV